jgi:hypothetical protein
MLQIHGSCNATSLHSLAHGFPPGTDRTSGNFRRAHPTDSLHLSRLLDHLGKLRGPHRIRNPHRQLVRQLSLAIARETLVSCAPGLHTRRARNNFLREFPSCRRQFAGSGVQSSRRLGIAHNSRTRRGQALFSTTKQADRCDRGHPRLCEGSQGLA